MIPRRGIAALAAGLLLSAAGRAGAAPAPPLLRLGADGSPSLLSPAAGPGAGRHGELLDAFATPDGATVELRFTPLEPFTAAPEGIATLEDVDWRSSPRHGGDAHARRLYPRAFRSAAGPRWSFSLAEPAPARAAFSPEGRYLPGSAAGGVLMLHDHITRADAIEAFGPPVGGRFRVALGRWFHDAAHPDERPGYGGVGHLTMRLAAVRRGALLLVADPAPGDAFPAPGFGSLGDACDYRLTTFRTSSDGEPTAGLGTAVEEPPVRDRVFASLSPDGIARAVILRPLDGRMLLVESDARGRLATREVALDSSAGAHPVPVDVGPSAPGAPEAAHPSRDGRVYVFPSTLYRAADTPLGRGAAFARLSPDRRAVGLRHAGPAFPDEPWLLAALPAECLDAAPDGAGHLLALFAESVPLDAVDAALDATPLDPAAAEARFAGSVDIEPGAVERDGDRFRRVVRIGRPLRVALARLPYSGLLAGASDLPGAAPSLTLRAFAPYVIARHVVAMERATRILAGSREDLADASWLMPSQRDGASLPIPPLRLGRLAAPPARPAEPPVADLVAAGAETTTAGVTLLPADRPLAFLAENPPRFDPDGKNVCAAPFDLDGDGVAACLPADAVERSVIYRFRLEEERDAGGERSVAAADRVRGLPADPRPFDAASRCLELPGFGRDLADRAERSPHPWLFSVPPLPPGRYRLSLSLGYDVEDATGRRAGPPLRAEYRFTAAPRPAR